MPAEFSLLMNQPEPLEECPRCKSKFFKSFLRGMVHRRRKRYFLWGAWDYCAVICASCKEIVGWESP